MKRRIRVFVRVSSTKLNQNQNPSEVNQNQNPSEVSQNQVLSQSWWLSAATVIVTIISFWTRSVLLIIITIINFIFKSYEPTEAPSLPFVKCFLSTSVSLHLTNCASWSQLRLPFSSFSRLLFITSKRLVNTSRLWRFQVVHVFFSCGGHLELGWL